MSLHVSTISSYFLDVLVAGACDAVACADGAAAVDFPRWEPQAEWLNQWPKKLRQHKPQIAKHISGQPNTLPFWQRPVPNAPHCHRHLAATCNGTTQVPQRRPGTVPAPTNITAPKRYATHPLLEVRTPIASLGNKLNKSRMKFW